MAAAITCTTMIALAASAVATAGVTLGIACLGMGCYAAASSQSNDMGRAR